jgi:hypothetical protein
MSADRAAFVRTLPNTAHLSELDGASRAEISR